MKSRRAEGECGEMGRNGDRGIHEFSIVRDTPLKPPDKEWFLIFSWI